MPRAKYSAFIELSDSEDAYDFPPPTSSQSSAVIDIPDSDDDDDEPAWPASSQASSVPLDIEDSDDELPPAAAMASAALAKARAKGKRKRDADYDDESESSEHELEASPPKTRKTRAEPASRSAQKELKAQEKQREKELKAAQRAADKHAKANLKAAAQQQKKTYKDANKLVSDKRKTLKDMEIVFPAVFAEADKRALFTEFKKRVDGYEMVVSLANSREVRGLDVFTWNRTKRAEYDVAAREWMPVEEYVAREGTVAVYIEAAKLMEMLRAKQGSSTALQLRTVFKDSRLQIFFVVYGMKAFVGRGVTQAVRIKDEVECAVASFQMAEGVHFVYVETVAEAVERLYDLSADLGIKPHKLIERSHLRFCSNTDQRSGKSPMDTWRLMIEQVHRMTESGAEGIVEQFPTPRSLFEAYERAANQPARDNMVADCAVERRKDGQQRVRNNRIGNALSSVVGTVLWDRDPLTLVNKANP
ncbi:ERCC4 domain-containing protein [Mycena indigotica]|uniref:ERCC4 domain-containing protein n=1 Tax=Mycena indigotica TaxID=2126181 RepID=A0A8H6T874_9AGAR|nr:ERCC4 domain-containing protein [Mycena indigotica]KAF7312011.1 ERCC4 domain-containing protein [Mycena indigotica]